VKPKQDRGGKVGTREDRKGVKQKDRKGLNGGPRTNRQNALNLSYNGGGEKEEKGGGSAR